MPAGEVALGSPFNTSVCLISEELILDKFLHVWFYIGEKFKIDHK